MTGQILNLTVKAREWIQWWIKSKYANWVNGKIVPYFCCLIY